MTGAARPGSAARGSAPALPKPAPWSKGRTALAAFRNRVVVKVAPVLARGPGVARVVGRATVHSRAAFLTTAVSGVGPGLGGFALGPVGAAVLLAVAAELQAATAVWAAPAAGFLVALRGRLKMVNVFGEGRVRPRSGGPPGSGPPRTLSFSLRGRGCGSKRNQSEQGAIPASTSSGASNCRGPATAVSDAGFHPTAGSAGGLNAGCGTWCGHPQ